MTREQQKAYNAENYPASVLKWLNEATDRAYDDFESRTCENCIQGLTIPNDNLYLECATWRHIRIKTYGCNYFQRVEPKE